MHFSVYIYVYVCVFNHYLYTNYVNEFTFTLRYVTFYIHYALQYIVLDNNNNNYNNKKCKYSPFPWYLQTFFFY